MTVWWICVAGWVVVLLVLLGVAREAALTPILAVATGLGVYVAALPAWWAFGSYVVYGHADFWQAWHTFFGTYGRALLLLPPMVPAAALAAIVVRYRRPLEREERSMAARLKRERLQRETGHLAT